MVLGFVVCADAWVTFGNIVGLLKQVLGQRDTQNEVTAEPIARTPFKEFTKNDLSFQVLTHSI